MLLRSNGRTLLLKSASAALAALALWLPVAALAADPAAKEGTETWYLDRARSNMQIGNYKAAIEAYQKAVKLNPDNRDAMKQLGEAYEKQGLTTDAIKQYDRYLERFQDDPDIAFKQADYLGWSRFAYRRDDAIRYYRMGLKMREDQERRHKLAQLLARDRKDLDDALEQYRVLLKAKPDNETWRGEYRKLLVWDDKNLKEAISEYRRYAKQKKGDFETDRTLATLLARENPKSEEAIGLYADLVKRKPNDAALRREYADLLSGSASGGNRKSDQAIEQYRKLVASDPKPETRHEFAKLLAQDRSHLDEALKEYQKLLAEQPNNAEWRAEYRKLLLWDPGHLDESIKEQRKVVAAKPGDFDAKRTLAQLLVRQNPNSSEARTLYDELMQKRPQDTQLRFEYAELLGADPERRAAAITEYRKLVERDPKPETRHKLARLLAADRSQLDEAVAEYRSLLQAQPGNAEWRTEYRELLLWDDRYAKDAIQEYRRVVSERPGDIEAQHTLARLVAHEDPSGGEAVSLYADLVKRQPADAALRLEYADLLAADKAHRGEAIEQYKTLVQSDPQPETRYKLARLLAQDRAQVDDALAQYRILLKAQPNNAEWRTEYRKALLWDEKNTKEAVVEYRRYAAEKPGDFEVHHQLAQLLARENPRSGEAVALYASLVESRPDDIALRREYVALLAADPSRRNESIEEYRRLVARDPTPEAREQLADLVSGKPEGRDEAMKQYQQLLAEDPHNTSVRLKYARLLAAKRKDTPKAIEEYETIVSDEPKNGEAHAGLALGYAAMRRNNLALREANLAAKYGADESDLVALRKDLMRVHDPNLQGYAKGLVQRGRSKTELDGVEAGVGGRVDAGTAVTLSARGGGETYSGNVRGQVGDYDRESEGGVFGRGDAVFHLSSEDDLGLGGGWHSIGERSYEARADYTHLGEHWKIGFGAQRQLRYDSFVALVGDKINGREIGSARENRLRLFARYQGDKAEFGIEPYGGFVDAKSVSGNPFVGGRIDWRYRLFSSDHVDFYPTLALEGYHYKFDAFGIDFEPGHPKPGGYFSPTGFASGEPGLALSLRLGESLFLDIEGGPAVQVVKENDPSWSLGIGGQGKAEFVAFLLPQVYWAIGGDVKSLGAAYTRFGAETRIGIEF